jgi:hypothetical protein
MNLQLIKIKRQNAFDYSLLSDFMKKKNGKLIFTAGFGNTGKIKENRKRIKLNLMQKFERNFQIQSIFKSYNEAFHINPKKSSKNLFVNRNQRIFFFPNLTRNQESEIKKWKTIKMNKSSTFNQFSNKQLLKSSSFSLKPNLSMNASSMKFYNSTLDNNKNDNSVDYNQYFYHTIDCFPQGTISTTDKDCLNKNKTSSTINFYSHDKKSKKKLFRNISQDCIYLFGKNKIIYKNKKDKSRNDMDVSCQKSENEKTPFIDYNKEFNPYKTKNILKNKYEFYKDKTKSYETFAEMKQNHIYRIRKMFEKKKNVNYRFACLPSHKTVKTMIRKKQKFDSIE